MRIPILERVFSIIEVRRELCCQSVVVVQVAQHWLTDQAPTDLAAHITRSIEIRRYRANSLVRSGLSVGPSILRESPTKMAFTLENEVIEDFTSKRANHPLATCIRVWSSIRARPSRGFAPDRCWMGSTSQAPTTPRHVG